MSDDNVISDAEAVRVAVNAVSSQLMQEFQSKDTSKNGTVTTGEFRKIVYFHAGLNFATVNDVLEKSSVLVSNGMIDYEKFLSRCLLTTPSAAGRGGSGGGSEDYAVLLQVRDAVVRSQAGLVDALRQQDSARTGKVPTAVFKRALSHPGGLSAPQIDAVFKFVPSAAMDTGLVDYVHWIDFFITPLTSSRSTSYRMSDFHSAHSASPPRGVAPTPEKEALRASIRSLSAASQGLSPEKESELVSQMRSLNLSSLEQLELLREMPISASKKLDVYRELQGAGPLTSSLSTRGPSSITLQGQAESDIIAKIRSTDISPRKKLEMLHDLPLSASRKLELLHELRQQGLSPASTPVFGAAAAREPPSPIPFASTLPQSVPSSVVDLQFQPLGNGRQKVTIRLNNGQVVELVALDEGGRASVEAPSPSLAAPKPSLLGGDKCVAPPLSRTSEERAAFDEVSRRIDVSVLAVAESEFRAADRDKSGDLDAKEIKTLFTSIWKRLGKTFPPDFRNILEKEVSDAITKYDKDGNGKINLAEFYYIIDKEPWRGMLPKPVRESFEVDEVLSAHPEVAVTLKRIFKDLDKDSSGELDATELKTLFAQMWKHLGKNFPSNFRAILNEQVPKLIKRYDRDGNGRISIVEFIPMLQNSPWKEMLPKPSRDKIEVETALAFDKAAIDAIKQVFDSVDKDKSGALDVKEIKTLFVKVWKILGKSFPSNFNELLNNAVQEIMRRYDVDGDGKISLSEFLNVISRSPWNKLLPRKTSDRVAVDIAMSMDPQAAAYTRALFTKYDVDGSGELEVKELKRLFADVWKYHVRKPFPENFTEILDRHVKNAMREHDRDENGALAMSELLPILNQHPWSSWFMVDKTLVADAEAATPVTTDAEVAVSSPPASSSPPESVTTMDVIAAAASLGSTVVNAARAAFDAADKDKSGEIDERELKSLFSALWKSLGKEFPSNFREILEKEVKYTIAKFDTDGNGCISFNEFLVLINMKPWCALLPKGAQDDIALEQLFGDDMEMITLVKKVFREIDIDNSGELDKKEIKKLFTRVWRLTGKQSFPPNFREVLESETNRVFQVYDSDHNGTISIAELVPLLKIEPYRSLFPKNIKNKISLESALALDNAAIAAVMAVFREVDIDGSGELDIKELKHLFTRIWRKFGKPFPSNYRELLGNCIGELMERYDSDASGTIDIVEFLKMVSQSPWDKLLPKDMQSRVAIDIALSIDPECASYVRQLFARYDVDGSGELEAKEVKRLFTDVWKSHVKKPFPADYSKLLDSRVTELLQTLDTDQSGGLTMVEIMPLLASTPWDSWFIRKGEIVSLPEVEPIAAEAVESTQPDSVTSATPAAPSSSSDGGSGSEPPLALVVDNAVVVAATLGDVVVSAARQVFTAADRDKSGEIDQKELKSAFANVWKILGKEFPKNFASILDEAVRDAIRRFDSDGNGFISFAEFLDLINSEPWNRLLPRPAREAMMVEKFFGDDLDLLEMVRRVFREMDKDESGELDEKEIKALITKLWRKSGQPFPADYRDLLHKAALECLSIFDEDGNGRISMSEFVPMLRAEPFASMLPRKVHDTIALEDALAMDKDAVKAVKAIFAEYDKDKSGTLEIKEIKTLFSRLWKMSGKAFPSDFNKRCQSCAEELMRRYDADLDGKISLPEFLNMICRAPWNQLLPRGMKDRMAVDVAMSMDPSAAAIVRQLFAKYDTDGSGELDQKEIKHLFTDVWKYHVRKPFPPGYGDLLTERVLAVLASYDRDHNGCLTLAELLPLLCEVPWSKWFMVDRADSQQQAIPEAAQAEIQQKIETAEDLAFTAASELGKDVVHAAREAFNGVLAKGHTEIDRKDLKRLFTLLWKKRGKVFDSAYAELLEAKVDEAIKAVDADGNGSISFSEFLVLVNEEPWALTVRLAHHKH